MKQSQKQKLPNSKPIEFDLPFQWSLWKSAPPPQKKTLSVSSEKLPTNMKSYSCQYGLFYSVHLELALKKEMIDAN